MIIGLCGKNGSGKGEAAKFLKERAFQYHSLSDAIREEAQKRDLEISRETLIALGTELRAKGGAGVLAERIFEKLDLEKNYVIDSIRHPAEIQVLRRRKDFILIQIVADEKTRFERMKIRAREKDPQDWDSFQKLEEKEAASSNAAAQQVNQAIELADIVIDNNAEIEKLHEALKKILLEITQKTPRPDWDEYFMNIAKAVALRSNCMKRKIAAVIVKDRRIISTGYNGTPRGIKNCNEGGCPRCNAVETSGKDLGECLCSHGEENAIVQAAYHGVSIKGATLYTTFSPCLMCTKMIINAGISKVVYQASYPFLDISLRLLGEAGVVVSKMAVA